MKEHLLELVRNIQAEGHNFDEQPIIFKWEWADELPGVGFQLLIHGTTPTAENAEDDEEGEVVVAEGNTTIH